MKNKLGSLASYFGLAFAISWLIWTPGFVIYRAGGRKNNPTRRPVHSARRIWPFAGSPNRHRMDGRASRDCAPAKAHDRLAPAGRLVANRDFPSGLSAAV